MEEDKNNIPRPLGIGLENLYSLNDIALQSEINENIAKGIQLLKKVKKELKTEWTDRILNAMESYTPVMGELIEVLKVLQWKEVERICYAFSANRLDEKFEFNYSLKGWDCDQKDNFRSILLFLIKKENATEKF